MERKLLDSFLIFSFVFLGCFVMGQDTNTLETVPKILEIKYSVEKNKDKNSSLIIEVTGETPSAGWKNPTLAPRVYAQPPTDGIWEYDFQAIRPEMSAQIPTSILASHKWENYPQSIKGIRVYGIGEGVKERLFGEKSGNDQPGIAMMQWNNFTRLTWEVIESINTHEPGQLLKDVRTIYLTRRAKVHGGWLVQTIVLWQREGVGNNGIGVGVGEGTSLAFVPDPGHTWSLPSPRPTGAPFGG